MTEHEDLIAEAHEHLDKAADAAPVSARQAILTGKVEDQRLSLVARLAHALEKVTAERDVLSSLREQMSLRLRYVEGKREQAEAERDQLAAVVEQVREFAASKKRPHVDVAGILPILNAADTTALDRVKAEERERIAFRLIGPEENLAASVRAFKAGWHQADLSGKTGQRVADGLRNVVADRIEKGESNE